MNNSPEKNSVNYSSLVKISGLSKSFPGVQALKSTEFELAAGEIHAIVGENGAGKSTMIKVFTGVHLRDEGEIIYQNKPVIFNTPLEAQQAGIATIYQEFTLIPSLSVAANIFLGHELSKGGIIDRLRENRKAEELLNRLGGNFSPSKLISDLTVAQQQIVEIARALSREAKVLVMDEPTAALSPTEISHLFDILKELTEQGMGIVFISHRLDEVLSMSHRVTVMRDGATVATRNTADFSRSELIELMVGRSMDQEYFKEQVSIGDICLKVQQLEGGMIRDISFEVHHGEILGLAGLMGAGRTEVARLIFGADIRDKGDIKLDGHLLEITNPHDAIEGGICLLTEDRKAQGLILGASVKENFALPNLESWSYLGWINQKRESMRFADQVLKLNIRISQTNQKAEELSGGNQQKLLVARWLEANTAVIMFDEPTRGIDVGAKYEMYQLIGKLASQGKAIIVISSELPELLGICDRILVMKGGRIAGEINDMKNATQESVMALAV
ncbi:MAG: sugar ABC transporter ATP-binding protein [bacterium]